MGVLLTTSSHTTSASANRLAANHISRGPTALLDSKHRIHHLCRSSHRISFHSFPTSANMAQFRAKKLDLGCFVNIKTIRDHTKRKVFQDVEAERYVRCINMQLCYIIETCCRAEYMLIYGWDDRQALRYTIRNTALPQRTRAQAQLELAQMHAYTRPTQIRNRCIMGGKGRGVFSDFRMARVSQKSKHMRF